VGEVVEPDGVEAGVAEEDLEHAARGGVPLEDDLDIVPDRSEHLPSMPRNIIRQNVSIIRHFGEKGKDFLQPLLLDPGDGEKVPGGTEPPDAIPLRYNGVGNRVGDPGELRDLPQGRLVDIYPFSKEVFLTDREGSASGAFGGKDGRRVIRGGREYGRYFVPVQRREKPEPGDALRRGDRIPDQQDQG
jgi:hypothetical protein